MSERPDGFAVAMSRQFVRLARVTAVACGLTFGGSATARAVAPEVTRFTLDNGLSVSIIHIEAEPLFCLFTYLPNGLATDEAGHTLWTRLI